MLTAGKYPDLKRLCILHYPDSRLRENARTIQEINAFLDEMAGRMKELMTEANGVGLAATQVGWPFRFILLNTTIDPGHVETFINPVILARKGRLVVDEGCLSVPGVYAKVRRAAWVRVRADLLTGETVEFEAEELVARAVQHELDHLEGALFIDRLGPAAKIMISSQLHALERQSKDTADSEAPDDD